MVKLIGYLMSLLVIFNTYDPGVIKDLEGAIKSVTNLANANQASFNQINNAIDELSRVSYDVNGRAISFNDLVKSYSLKLNKMKQSGNGVAYAGCIVLLILLILSGVIPMALLLIFVVRLITNKDKKAYIQNKLRPVLYFAGCSVTSLLLFSGFFLRLTNI